MDLGGAEEINGKPLKEQREAGVGHTPRHGGGEHAMRRTADAGDGGDQICLELAAIQVPPGPRFAMIIKRRRRATGRTAPGGLCGLGKMDMHGLVLKVEGHMGNRPRSGDAQKLLIEFNVMHR